MLVGQKKLKKKKLKKKNYIYIYIYISRVTCNFILLLIYKFSKQNKNLEIKKKTVLKVKRLKTS